MKVYILFFLTCVAVISVRGQYLSPEYGLDSVPLPIRRRQSNARYEIQPSVSREIEYQNAETTKISSQGRRHIDNHHRGNVQNVHNLRHEVNDFETKPNENHNFELIQPVNNDNQFIAQTRHQNPENYVRESNIQNVNRNLENQNYGEINPIIYDTKLKTNLQNTHSHQNRQDPSGQDTFSELRNYPSNDNARTKENFNNQQSNLRTYENINKNQSPARTNANNRNFVKASLNQDSYNQQNYPSNDNVRTFENPTNQQTDKSHENSRTSDNNDDNCRTTFSSEETGTSTRRTIRSNCENKRNFDSTRVNNNRNMEYNPSRQNTETRKEAGNRNNENVQATEPTRRITTKDRVITGGTKSTQDNELASGTYPGDRSGTVADEKWIWNNQDEISTKTTVETTLPAVDDRASFVGDKCPSGMVKINKMCVNKD